MADVTAVSTGPKIVQDHEYDVLDRYRETLASPTLSKFATRDDVLKPGKSGKWECEAVAAVVRADERTTPRDPLILDTFSLNPDPKSGLPNTIRMELIDPASTFIIAHRDWDRSLNGVTNFISVKGSDWNYSPNVDVTSTGLRKNFSYFTLPEGENPAIPGTSWSSQDDFFSDNIAYLKKLPDGRLVFEMTATAQSASDQRVLLPSALREGAYAFAYGTCSFEVTPPAAPTAPTTKAAAVSSLPTTGGFGGN
jgi:hypothetical protein